MRDNVVTSLIHRLKGPAYSLLLGSVILRGLIGVLIIATAPYNTWPLPLRLCIDIGVFFGVVICGEILFCASVAARARFARDRRNASEEDMPAFRGKPEIVAQQVTAWNKRQERRLRNLREEIHTESFMAVVGMLISSLYAVNFFVELKVTDKNVLDFFNLLIEIFSILTAIVVLYYFSARLKEERPDIADQSEGIVVKGVAARLTTAATRAEKGQEEDTDITLMSLALPKGHVMQRLLPALRQHGNKLLTSADIFTLLGIDDESAQRGVRRALYKAGSAGLYGVYKDPEENSWRLPAGQLHSFIEYANLSGDKKRTQRGKVAREILATPITDADTAQQRQGAGSDTEQPVSVIEQPPPIAQMWAMGYAE